MIVWLIDWKWVKFETFWKFNEREWNDFPKTFTLHFDPQEFKFISSLNPRVKMIWLLPFKEMKRDLERIWISNGKYFQIQKLYATQWFSWGKIKWLLQIIWNMSWKLKERIWKWFKIQTQTQFGVIWFLFNLFFSKNKIYGK